MTRLERYCAICLVLFVSLLLPGFAAVMGDDGTPDEFSQVGMIAEANNEFAIDLYRQLARDGRGTSLFFSPFSMLSALTMTAEGARGETARQMGEALKFPPRLARHDDDAKENPWDMLPMHSGISSLHYQLRSSDEVKDDKLRKRIAELRDELEAANEHTRVLELAAEERSAKLRETVRDDLERIRMFQDGDNLRERHEVGVKAWKLANKLNDLLSQVDQYEFRVANALWGEKSYPFREDYIATLDRFYGTGGVFPVDFMDDSEAARLLINEWVEKRTNRRIKDLIPESMLSPDTRLILTNAIYFKGEWAAPFDEGNTKPRSFTLTDGTTCEVPMMVFPSMEYVGYAAFNADASYFNTPTSIPLESASEKPDATRRRKAGLEKYPADSGFAMLELPYKGKRLSMVLIAPNHHNGLTSIEKMLDTETLNRWISQLKKRDVHVYLPKFKLETDYEFKKILQQLGMKRAFKNPLFPGGAQFAGMSDSSESLDQLFIEQVMHKAFVEVSEKGTEAAAATAVIMVCGAAMSSDVPFTPTFRADRPFIFIIRDIPTGSMLFMGRMMQP